MKIKNTKMIVLTILLSISLVSFGNVTTSIVYADDISNVKDDTIIVGESIQPLALIVEWGGTINWFDAIGEIGYDGKSLGTYDCATRQGFDNPVKGTEIHVSRNGTSYEATLYKWDIGPMSPENILDISEYVMENVFHVDAGYTSGEIAYGSFEGWYWHSSPQQ